MGAGKGESLPTSSFSPHPMLSCDIRGLVIT